MTGEADDKVLRLRPHHIFCSRFLPLHLLARGDEFSRVMEEIRDLIRTESDLEVEVTEGPDQLCMYCPDFSDGRCQNPVGDEEKVRKWDSRIADGLGLRYGERRTVRAFLDLIEEKAPLEFCASRCPWREICAVFGD